MTDKVPVIELMQSGLLITSLKLEGGAQWLIGRSLDCNLTINHPTLSRKHARVHLEDGAYYLTDLGSTHGTRIAGKPLQPQQPTRLFDGLKITLGDHKGELLPANMMTAIAAMVPFSTSVTLVIGRFKAVPKQAHRMVRFCRRVCKTQMMNFCTCLFLLFLCPEIC